MLRGERKVIDRIDSHRFEVVEIVVGHLTCQRFDGGIILRGTVNQFVIDVGNVDHIRHFVPKISKVPFDRVKNHRSDHVADMRRFVDRRPAQVDAHLTGDDRLEFLFLMSQSVVDT